MDKIPPPRREDVVIPDRKSMSKKQRAAYFLKYGPYCHFCNEKIGPEEPWDRSHLKDLELSGDDSDENTRPAHRECHKTYTHGEGNPRIYKARRLNKKHKGEKAPSKHPIQSRGFPAERPKTKWPKQSFQNRKR